MRLIVTLSIFLASVGTAAAESHNPKDYPLRVHIFKRSETTFYHHHVEQEAKGEGKANLFEGGEPTGIDFAYDCDTKLQTSSGFETFPAKWKKPGHELVILEPKFGKDGYDSCHLKVMVKDFVYVTQGGTMGTEAANVFKQWMASHQYDPEHGMNQPTQGAPAADARKPLASGATAVESSPSTRPPPQ